MRIEYKDLCIRNAERKDCEQLAVWWNDGKVMAHAGFPNGLHTNAERIGKQLGTDNDETGRRLIIEKNGLSIGEMVYRNKGNRIAEIGIKICNQDFQEKGIGKVVLSMLIHELFQREYSKIILDTNLNNKRAQHVYEQLGFKKIRINIDSWQDQLGNLQSSLDYELLEEDFVDYR